MASQSGTTHRRRKTYGSTALLGSDSDSYGGPVPNLAVALSYVSNGAATVASNGIPLEAGALTSAQVTSGYGVLYNNGVEVQVFIKALKGLHRTNNTLRSILIQAAVADVSSGTLTFKPSAIRTLSARSETAITVQNVRSHARMLPTSAQYICDTRVNMVPLVPFSAMTAGELGLLETRGDAIMDVIEALPTVEDIVDPSDAASHSIASLAGDLAMYNPHGMMWRHQACNGSHALWTEALKRSVQVLYGATVPAADTTFNIDGISPIVNGVGDAFIPSTEQYRNMTVLGFVPAYWWSGCEQFRRTVNKESGYIITWNQDTYSRYNAEGFSGSGLAVIPGTGSIPRTAWSISWAPMIAGYTLECELAAPANVYTPILPDYETVMAWLIDLLVEHTVVDVGAYWDGASMAVRLANLETGTSSRAWMHGIFFGEMLPLYYQEVKADSRLLDIIVMGTEVLYQNTRVLVDGDYGYSSGETRYGLLYDIRLPSETVDDDIAGAGFGAMMCAALAIADLISPDAKWGTKLGQMFIEGALDGESVTTRPYCEVMISAYSAPAYTRMSALPAGPSTITNPS